MPGVGGDRGTCRILPPDGAPFIVVFTASYSHAPQHFQGTSRNHVGFMMLISWALMLPALPRPKSHSALLRGHLAFNSLYWVRDRILVTHVFGQAVPCAQGWTERAVIWGSSQQTGGRAPFSDWSI